MSNTRARRIGYMRGQLRARDRAEEQSRYEAEQKRRDAADAEDKRRYEEGLNIQNFGFQENRRREKSAQKRHDEALRKQDDINKENRRRWEIDHQRVTALDTERKQDREKQEWEKMVDDYAREIRPDQLEKLEKRGGRGILHPADLDGDGTVTPEELAKWGEMNKLRNVADDGKGNFTWEYEDGSKGGLTKIQRQAYRRAFQAYDKQKLESQQKEEKSRLEREDKLIAKGYIPIDEGQQPPPGAKIHTFGGKQWFKDEKPEKPKEPGLPKKPTMMFDDVRDFVVDYIEKDGKQFKPGQWVGNNYRSSEDENKWAKLYNAMAIEHPEMTPRQIMDSLTGKTSALPPKQELDEKIAEAQSQPGGSRDPNRQQTQAQQPPASDDHEELIQKYNLKYPNRRPEEIIKALNKSKMLPEDYVPAEGDTPEPSSSQSGDYGPITDIDGNEFIPQRSPEGKMELVLGNRDRTHGQITEEDLLNADNKIAAWEKEVAEAQAAGNTERIIELEGWIKDARHALAQFRKMRDNRQIAYNPRKPTTEQQ